MRQAQQRTVKIVSRHGAAARHLDTRHVVGNQAGDGSGGTKEYRRAAIPEHGKISAELERVTEALFRVYENPLAGGVAAVPGRSRRRAMPRLCGEEAPLVVGPARSEVSLQQPKNAQAGVGVGLLRIERQSP